MPRTGVGWKRAIGIDFLGSRRSDLNRWPAVYETAALPLSYVGNEQQVRDPPQGAFYHSAGHILLTKCAFVSFPA